MKLKNSYIYILQQNSTKLQENRHFLTREEILNINDLPLKPIAEHFKLNIINNNYSEKRQASGKLKINSSTVSIFIELTETKKAIYLSVSAEGAESNCIEALEKIHDYINEDLGYNRITITSFDSISNYYCKKAYPLLSNFDRKLRLLMLNIFTYIYGENYFEQIPDKDFKINIKEIIQAKGNKTKKSTERLKLAFYSLDYSKIIKLLFNIELNENPITTQIETNTQSTQSCAESNNYWHILFSKKIPDVEFKNKITKISKLRNSIAHSKLFYKKDYEHFITLVNDLSNKIEQAIEITQEDDFNKLYQEMKNSERKMFELAEKNVSTLISNSILKYFTTK